MPTKTESNDMPDVVYVAPFIGNENWHYVVDKNPPEKRPYRGKSFKKYHSDSSLQGKIDQVIRRVRNMAGTASVLDDPAPELVAQWETLAEVIEIIKEELL